MKSTLIRVCLAAWCALVVPASAGLAAERDDLARELLRQPSAAERSVCGAVRAVLSRGRDAALVVKTAVEMGHNPCQVIRCAVEGGADLGKVIVGAAAAGVKEDVISRCALEGGGDPAAIAGLFARLILETDFCYFGFRPAGAADPLPPEPPVIERDYSRPGASPFDF